MNIKTEEKKNALDTPKLVVALAIIIGSVVVFYQYAEFSLLYRVMAMLVMIGIAIALAMQTHMGSALWAFGVNSRTEVRKVVWPSRREASQTTLMVFIMVFLMGIALWLVDMSLAAIVRTVTGA